jgi:rhodanese-related sulfurtransferase
VPVPEIDIDEFARRREAGAPVLDVREPDEYREAHVAGATLIPLATVPDRLDDVPEGDLLVICRSGARSMRAAEFLASKGVSATTVAGGTLAWIESGRPVVEGDEPG